MATPRPTPFKGYLRGLTVPTTRMPCKLWDQYDLQHRREVNSWLAEAEEDERQIKIKENRRKAKILQAKWKAEREEAKRKAEQLEAKRKADREEALRKAEQKAEQEEARRKAERLEAKQKAKREEAKRKLEREQALRLQKLKVQNTVKTRKASLFNDFDYSEEDDIPFANFYDIFV